VFRSKWWGAGSGAAGVLGAFEFIYSPHKAAARQEIEEQRRRTVPIPAPGDGPLIEFGPEPATGPDPAGSPSGASRRFVARVVLRRPPATDGSAAPVPREGDAEPGLSAHGEQSTPGVDVIK